ncbi:MAG: TRAP transporter permease [Peptococcaceae bacterium]|nr:TRAP transporter permease [Peptococcaceae bacterium]
MLFKKRTAVKAADTEALIESVEKESRFRKYGQASKIGKIITCLCIVWSLFHLYTGGFGELHSVKQRAITLCFALVLAFLLYPARKGAKRSRPTLPDLIFLLLSVYSCAYIFFNLDIMQARGGILIPRDYIAGAICVVVVFEAARRVMGLILPSLSLLFLFYNFIGRAMPGILNHGGFTLKRVIEHMYVTTDGIFGTALGVAASYIILFVLFGCFLAESGLGSMINDFSMAVAGTRPGGPAKVAVVGSGLMGMINGSPVATCATMGAFVIPQMKKVGYQAHFAGAVEAVAATGGAVMPPVMGAAAFLIVEFLGVPYKTVMFAAIIPSLLYYYCCIMQVHFEALKSGIKGLDKAELPKLGPIVKSKIHLLIPLVVIVWLLVSGATATNAAFYAILSTIAASMLRKETRITWKGFLRALENGSRGSISVVLAVSVVGFIIGTCGLTGLGMRLADSIVMLGQGHLFLTLCFTMIACTILGMGLPTTACYIVAATIAAPALLKLGVPELPAHFFVFYLANLSNITPPVALAAFTGAAIAEANPNKVGWTAFKLGIAGFIVSFTFVYSPEFLLQDGLSLGVVWAFATAVLGVTSLSAGLESYWLDHCRIWERLLFIIGGILLFVPGLATDICGFIMISLGFSAQYLRTKKKEANVGAEAL